MNKLVLLVLAAVVGCVAANPLAIDEGRSEIDEGMNETYAGEYEIDEERTQLALFEDDEKETVNVKQELFGDYCLRTRDKIKQKLGENVNKSVSDLFSIMVESFGGITEEVLRKQQASIEEGKKLIKGHPEELDDIEQDIKKEHDAIANKGLIARFIGALTGVVRFTANTIYDESISCLMRAKEQLNSKLVKSQIEAACKTVTMDFMVAASEDFSNAKSELKLANSKTGSSIDQQSILETTFQNVGCLTTSRLQRLANVCNVLQTFGHIIYPLVGITDRQW